jgi:hypothetical protein
MQVSSFFNNVPTASLFSEIQRINREQQSNGEPVCAEEQRRASSHRCGALGASMAVTHSVVVFEDSNIIIRIVDRGNHDLTQEELRAGRHYSRVVIFCKHRGYGVHTFDDELADKLYNKFMQMASEGGLNCTMDDFRNAKSEWIMLLFSQWLYEALFSMFDENRPIMPAEQRQAMTETQPADESTASKIHELLVEFFEKSGFEIVCRELLHAYVDAVQQTIFQAQPNIPVLPEEEMQQLEPNHHQRYKDGLFYGVYVK